MNLKRIIVAMCVMFLFAGAAWAKNPPKHVDTRVYLTEKLPADGLWLPAPGAVGHGFLVYSVFGPELTFKFNGFNLIPATEYALIYYPDPWPGEGLIVLATGIARRNGQIFLKGAANPGTLPIAEDGNFPGAKIWLIPSQFVGDGKLISWPDNSAGILFETALVNYYVTD